MSKTHPEWDIQGKRLSKVLDYLKYGVYPKKYISEVITELNDKYGSNLKSSDYSKFQSGESQIPNYVITALYEKYYINPDFILAKSNWMIDIFAELIDKIKNKKIDVKKSETCVNPIWIVSDELHGENLDYLVLKMDSRLYDYIMTISAEKLTEPISEEENDSNSIILNSKERKKIEDKIPNISQKAEYSFYSLMPSDKMDKLFNNNITFEKDISELKQSYHRLEEKINNISSKIPKEEMTAIKYEMQIGLDKIKKLSNS